MLFECIEFNTEEKQMECLQTLKNMGRCAFPMVFFIDDKRIGGYCVYYLAR